MAATIAVVRERKPGETRVAATPDSVKKLIGMGFAVTVETGAGLGSSFPDADYQAAGAALAPSAAAAIKGADLLFKVRSPEPDELAALKKGALVAALLAPYADPAGIAALASAGATAIAMEFIPRISRAQSMDALSSQANLAGYRAVIEGANLYGRALPMMMTAAGTVAAAKVFVMGVGVAGLQAIATARRLGAVVTATDVRPATKEQVESLGAKFLAVEDEEFKNAQTAGGYAKEMSAEYQAKQAALLSEHLKKQDIVITTALIPGRPAPKLVSAEQVASMKPGSVLVDLAVEQGGNVAGAQPGVTETGGVKIAGFTNLPAAIAADASGLYARNLVNLSALFVDKDKAFAPQWDDEILQGAVIVRDGEVVHEGLKTLAASAPATPRAAPAAKASPAPKAVAASAPAPAPKAAAKPKTTPAKAETVAKAPAKPKAAPAAKTVAPKVAAKPKAAPKTAAVKAPAVAKPATPKATAKPKTPPKSTTKG